MGALETAERLSRDRGARARELSRAGRKTVGYICLFPPVELITAAGLVPFRIVGSLDPATDADAYLERLMCPFVRSCFDLAIRKQLDFLDGLVWPHSCDNIQKTFDIWKHYVPHAFIHYLDVPHMTDPSSFEFFREELYALKQGLEAYTDGEITEERLADAVEAHNENRSLLREIAGLRRQDPPLLRGSEMMQIMLASTCLPVEESSEMLRNILKEVRSREDGPEKRSTRLLVYGSEIDDASLIRLFEESGANVVVEDLCMGSKSYLHDVSLEGDLLTGLANRYLGQISCPRTFRRSPGTRDQDLRQRFGYLTDLASEYNVNGALLYILMFCDCFAFDVPDARDVLEKAGIPTLHIEDDYSASGMSGLKTRVQAFVEMLSRQS